MHIDPGTNKLQVRRVIQYIKYDVRKKKTNYYHVDEQQYADYVNESGD